MKIYTDAPEGTTVIQNTFIDEYLPHANGEFVKVYLYLLRCANTGRELSLSSIADVFDHTEKDIQRALAYWEKQQLLHIRMAANGTIISVTFACFGLSGTETSPESDTGLGHTSQTPAPTISSDRRIQMPSRERISAIQDQQDIKQLIYVAEQYLQRPLTSTEQHEFFYYYDTLKFSTDLIEYLLEYCISKGSTSIHYMRKVAHAWAEAGISTVHQAKQETNLHNKNYFTVLKSFGIKGRGPAAPEQEIMSRWFDDFGFTIDLVLEACRRTIQQTHQPNFQYADKILEQWHQNGVTALSDVERLDRQHKSEPKSQPQISGAQSKNNRFNNFSQRNYNYDQLEKQLLGQS